MKSISRQLIARAPRLRFISMLSSTFSFLPFPFFFFFNPPSSSCSSIFFSALYFQMKRKQGPSVALILVERRVGRCREGHQRFSSTYSSTMYRGWWKHLPCLSFALQKSGKIKLVSFPYQAVEVRVDPQVPQSSSARPSPPLPRTHHSYTSNSHFRSPTFRQLCRGLTS